MRSILLFIVLIVLWSNTACLHDSGVSGSSKDVSGSAANRPDAEFSIKEKAVLNGPLPQAHELKVVRSVQSELGGNGPFVYPAALSVSDNGRVYVTDNNAHLIRYCPPDSESIVTMAPQEGNGKLVWPNLIECLGSSLLVTDNDGIKIFKEDGSFQQLLRTYYQINHFTIRPDGRIYVNPSFRRLKPDNPLVVELDDTGKRIRAFGVRLNGPDKTGLSDEIYLRTTRDYVVTVFKHSPMIRIYCDNGTLVREFKIEHAVFDELAKLSQDKEFVSAEPSKHRLPNFVSGARIMRDRLLVLLDLPYPEIVEFDLNGQELNRYRAVLSPPAKGCKGFDVHLTGNSYRFWILFGDGARSVSLAEFAI